MLWSVAQYWVSMFLSGVQIGLNPCALVVLWFFFVYLSENARNVRMVAAGGWIFLLTTLLTNVLLMFGFWDFVVGNEWFGSFFMVFYAVVAVALIIQGGLHFWDWRQYKFYTASVGKFKIPMPVFLGLARNASWREWTIFTVKGIVTALILNMLGAAWGHDAALFVSFSQVYFSVGVLAAGMHFVVCFIGYLLPLILVWAGLSRWAAFRGYEHLSGPHVAFSKILQAALSLAVGIILAVIVAREFFNI